jgi:hypothetical protein
VLSGVVSELEARLQSTSVDVTVVCNDTEVGGALLCCYVTIHLLLLELTRVATGMLCVFCIEEVFTLSPDFPV